MRDFLERIYEQEGLQRELTSDDFRGFERLLEWMAEHGQVFGFMLLMLILVGVLLLLFVLLESRTSVFFRRRKTHSNHLDEFGANGSLTAGSIDGLLAEADRLARSGRYGDAMHELLVGLLDWLRGDRGIEWRPAQTAREIAAIEDAAGTLGLREVVQASEQAYFGGYEAGPEAYDACRSAFTRTVSRVSNISTERRGA